MMIENEFNKQRNRFGRLLTFNNQLYIGALNDEISVFESRWRYSLQRQKMLEKMLTESYPVNRKLRDRLHSGLETMGPQPDSQPTTNESAHPNITRGPNTNGCGERWEDIVASFG